MEEAGALQALGGKAVETTDLATDQRIFVMAVMAGDLKHPSFLFMLSELSFHGERKKDKKDLEIGMMYSPEGSEEMHLF